MTKRSIAVDYLKAIGVLWVVLAHINPPMWLFNIRVMDVCMMIFASGLTLRYHGNSLKEYAKYLVKRFKRLVIPTWIFLCIYFGLSYCVGFHEPQWRYTVKDYIKSFTFMGGIDYIWIIRVYFLIAILSPLILKLSQSEAYGRHWHLIMALLLVVNELLASVSDYITNETIQKIFQNIFVYSLGYSVVVLSACSVKRVGVQKLFLFSAVLFLALWGLSGFSSPQNAKYPPQALYIVYGIFGSLLIYLACEKFGTARESVVDAVIQWLSRNSLWVYFWHILPITFLPGTGFENLHFLLRYVLVLAIACSLTIGQNFMGELLRKGK